MRAKPNTKVIWALCLLVFAPAVPLVVIAGQEWAFVPFAMAFGAVEAVAWFYDWRLRQTIRREDPQLLSDPKGSIMWAANDWDIRAVEEEDEVTRSPEMAPLAARARALRLAPIAGIALGVVIVASRLMLTGGLPR